LERASLLMAWEQGPYEPRLPTEREAWTAAAIVIEEHGDGAAQYAMGRIAALTAQGDEGGAQTWRLILGKIDALQAPPGSVTIRQ